MNKFSPNLHLENQWRSEAWWLELGFHLKTSYNSAIDTLFMFMT